MSDVFSLILPGGLPPLVIFPSTSRYASIPLLTLDVEGQEIRYLDVRLLPPLDAFVTTSEHVVEEGDRPDNLAARYLGDPEQSWRLCDANPVMHPAELVAIPGRLVRITLPQGFPGASGA
jgi:hypothetical protein